MESAVVAGRALSASRSSMCAPLSSIRHLRHGGMFPRAPSGKSFKVEAGGKTKKSKAKAAGKLSGKTKTVSLAASLAARTTSFASLPTPLVDRGPAVALAYTYLGDAVWEVYARQHMILRRATDAARPARPGTKNVAMRPQEATKRGWCSSVAMRGHLARLLEGDAITEEELAILKWGRDFGHEARSGHRKEEHAEASALEALVAYWYLFDAPRLHEVLSMLGMTMCAQPLEGLMGERVREAAVAAMDSLKVIDGVSSAGDEVEEDDEEDDEVEVMTGDDLLDEEEDGHEDESDEKDKDDGGAEGTSEYKGMDWDGGDAGGGEYLRAENATLREQVVELEAKVKSLEEELTLSRRGARMLRQRGR